jgi:hypothetical protein
LALACCFGAACGPPSSASSAKVTVVDPGYGEPFVAAINHGLGSRYTFGVVEAGRLAPVVDASYTRTITLTQGPQVVVYSTALEDIFIEPTAEGEYVWGGSSGLVQMPVLSIKLPLKQDLEWETADENGVPFYHYRVEAQERVDVPAGTFLAARTVQLNLRTSVAVTRWYAEEVGLVQRDNSLLLRYELTRETP